MSRAISRNHVIAAAVLVVALLAAAVLLLMPSKGGSSTQSPSTPIPAASIHAPSFSAPVPAGWTVRAQANAKGAHQFKLGSTAAVINGVDIGPAGTVAVTATEYGPEVLTRGHIHGRPVSSYTPVALLPYTVGQPARAEGVQVAEHPTATQLAGAKAGEEAFFYRYGGRENLQVDVLAEHAGHLFLVELDAEPRLQATSRSALSQILGGWRF
jgi:hypothetical protein